MGKAEDILSILRGELRRGRYPKGGRFPSEYSLMHRFEVSRPTVNKVTSQLEREGFIARGVRGSGTKVLEPSPFPVGHIAYIGPIAHNYNSRILQGIQSAAFRRNYAVSFLCPGEELLSYLEKVRNSNFCGVLASTIGKIPAPFPLPVVYLDDEFPIDGVIRSSVSCTNYLGARKMAKEVSARGHREIVICTTPGTSDSRAHRVGGFMDVLKENNISDVDKRVFYTGMNDMASATSTMKTIFRNFPETTVIMTDSDDIAVRFYKVTKKMKNIPEVSITGFGNIHYREPLLPIATVEQHPEEIGEQGVLELLHCLEDKNYYASEPIKIEAELKYVENIPYIK